MRSISAQPDELWHYATQIVLRNTVYLERAVETLRASGTVVPDELLGVGVIADLLLRAMPWGLNLTLATGLVVLAAWLLTRWGDVRLEGEGRWLVAPRLFSPSG